MIHNLLETMSKCNVVRPFSNIIPRHRTKGGQPVARNIVGTRPFLTFDPDSLLQAAQAFASSPEEGYKQFPLLKARNAIGTSENAVSLRQEFEEQMAVGNARSRTAIAELEPKSAELNDVAENLAARLAKLSAPLGLDNICGRQSMDMLDHEPMSLEEIAGKHHLPPPEENSSWANRVGYRLLCAIGGGAFLGLGLGLLTGKLELYSLSEEWPMVLLWIAPGIALMAIAGESLFALSKSLGTQLHLLSLQVSWAKNAVLAATLFMLAGLAAAYVTIESKVEMLGLFRAIGEESSLQGFRIAQRDLFWVSLLVILPVAACHVIQGLREGQRLANLGHLKALRTEMRQALRSGEMFASVCELHQRLLDAREDKDAIEGQIQYLQSSISTDFTATQKLRLEDMDMDAAIASYDAEEFMLSMCPNSDSFRSRPGRGLLRWLRTKLFPLHSSREAH